MTAAAKPDIPALADAIDPRKWGDDVMRGRQIKLPSASPFFNDLIAASDALRSLMAALQELDGALDFSEPYTEDKAWIPDREGAVELNRVFGIANAVLSAIGIRARED